MNIHNVKSGNQLSVPSPHLDPVRLASPSNSHPSRVTKDKTIPQSPESKSTLIEGLLHSRIESRAERISEIKARVQNDGFLDRDAAKSVAESILGN